MCLKVEKVTLTGTWHVDSSLVGLCPRLCASLGLVACVCDDGCKHNFCLLAVALSHIFHCDWNGIGIANLNF